MNSKKGKCTKPSLGHHISVIYRNLQIYFNQEFAAFGFGSGQYLYFNHISRQEGITQKELSEHLVIDKATTAKAIRKLDEQGYIRAEQHPKDKRSYCLFLTEKGRSIVPEVRKIMRNITSILSNGMSDKNSIEALGYLQTMYENIISHNEENRKKNN